MSRAARLRWTIAAAAFAAAAALAEPLPLQAQLFQRQYPDARADGIVAASRVAGMGVVELGYTRTLFNAPDASHAASLEWRPLGATPGGPVLRAVERRDGDARTRTFEIGWRLRF